MTDRNVFFYQVTTRICGDLDLSRAALHALRYLYDIMPAEEMLIALFDESRHKYRVITHTTLSDSELTDRTIELSSDAWSKIRQYDRKTTCTIDPSKDPVVSSIIATDGIARNGCVILPLNLKETFVGVVLLISRSGKEFRKNDLELLSSVSGPFGIALSNSLAYLELKEQKQAVDDENRALRSLFEGNRSIVGKDGGLRDVIEMVELVAPLGSPVLILGETGTGKELIANAIHNASPRRGNPFIKMNCGAIPENLADSELFGHEKGAFTGALQKHIGRFERANGGTLLLDEVGELPLDVQVKLLRVLQEHEFERVGGSKALRTDVRLICATNKSLPEMINQGKFREDLYYRINVFPITIPPLRQRTGDIPSLIEYLVEQKGKEMGISLQPEISSRDMDMLMHYSWPGNVRELQNIVERALIMRKGNRLCFENLLPFRQSQDEITLNGSMANIIRNALEKTNGKISGPNGAAALLDINPSTLRSRMKKLGMSETKRDFL